MTTSAPSRALVTPALLLLTFGGAVAIRVALAGNLGARSLPAAVAFAVVLAAVASVAGDRPALNRRVTAVGVVAGMLLVVPAALHLGVRASLPVGSFAPWAVGTAFVATTEEAFLRGALWTAVARRHGSDAAIVVAAVAFALLHVPLYGWHVLPLDLAVGLVLGVARLVAGSWCAPAIGHVGADLLGWWLL
jgi:membrane protease YdiL (CAAX protease family)